MAYWMCVYSQSEEVMEVETIQEFFDGQPVVIEVDPDETGAGWSQIELCHPDEDPIATISLRTGPDLTEALEPTIEGAQLLQPACNAEWVIDFLRGVKARYSFRIYQAGAAFADGWKHVRELQQELVEVFDGILYAELEGFSNPHGYH